MTPRTSATVSPADTAPVAAGTHGAAETHQPRADSDLEEALATARQDLDSQRRIEALQFLGEHALQEHLESLQQIQIQDPAPEVRRAAEMAVHLLMARFSGQPWPGVATTEQPFDYMKGLTSPEAP